MRTWSTGQPSHAALAGLLAAAMALPARAAEPPAAAEPAAAAEPTESNQAEALRLFREARVLYTSNQPREAAAAFERSFAAAASPEAAYNAALAHDRADDPLATLMWFQRYLEIAHRDTDPSYPIALAKIDELRARVGELRVELRQPDEVREILVNGEAVPKDSFPRFVLPGAIDLRFTGAAPGQVVDIPSVARAGETATIYFPGFTRTVAVTPPRPIARPVPAPDPGPSPRLRGLRIAFWTGTGITAASAALVGVFGGLAVHEFNTYRDKQSACAAGCDESLAARTAHLASAQRHENTTNAMIGVTAGLAVVTLALGIAALRESRRARAATTRASHVLPAVGGLRVVF